MADILIKGMEMPNKDEILVFDEWHGKVYARSTANAGTRRYEVFPLPEGHGRLIDADALIANHFSDEHRIALSPADKLWMRRIINREPTIVPAEGGENE